MIFHSPFDTSYLWLPLLGFLVGFIGTLVGGGGGFFFIPILTLVFHVPAQVALTTSLAATIPICIVGTIAHHRRGNVDIRVGLLFIVAGLLGAFAGAGITSLVSTKTLRIAWGIYAILIAIQILVNNLIRKREKASGVEKGMDPPLLRIGKSTFYGILAGVITSTFGTSGATPAQAGMFAMRMPIKAVVGTTLMIVLANTASSLGAHVVVGEVDLTLVLFLTAGAIIGSLIGPRVLSEVKLDKAEGPIRQWYAFGLIAFGILMIISNGGTNR